jgi:hypothetical protein
MARETAERRGGGPEGKGGGAGGAQDLKALIERTASTDPTGDAT